MIDYKDLLKKYMFLISECESYSYLAHADESLGLSKSEVEELERLWEEATK
jgi:hypothetical protein